VGARALGELGSDGLAIETSARRQILRPSAARSLWAELSPCNAVFSLYPTSPPCFEAAVRRRADRAVLGGGLSHDGRYVFTVNTGQATSLATPSTPAAHCP